MLLLCSLCSDAIRANKEVMSGCFFDRLLQSLVHATDEARSLIDAVLLWAWCVSSGLGKREVETTSGANRKSNLLLQSGDAP